MSDLAIVLAFGQPLRLTGVLGRWCREEAI
jgi:hypothetical protein